MDTSFWIQCNPDITVEHTTKKYFGKYLYKLDIYSPAGRLIYSKGDILSGLDHRKRTAKTINHAGWWGSGGNNFKGIDRADVGLLDAIRTLRNNPAHTIHLRVEEPHVQIYASTESELQSLVNNKFGQFLPALFRITGPESSTAANILETGAIIRKKEVGYKYKVILRDGRYTQEVKAGILQYLINIGVETIKLPKSAINSLGTNNSFIWNCYFYTNDLSINTFITLISPGIISKSHELVILADK